MYINLPFLNASRQFNLTYKSAVVKFVAVKVNKVHSKMCKQMNKILPVEWFGHCFNNLTLP
jgi:hypothetical protein